ncbi:hypothetical protein KJ853_00765 [Patescibacteria group bacterium]|nr:hypothetical protein [Patescibacteria group bacterium]
MKSKWYESKNRAIKLRKQGFSIGKIERKLNIPRSTLSGWFKNVKLSQRQKEKLLKNWKNGLIKARKKAVLWHNAQKEKRLKEAKDAALATLSDIDVDNKNNLELALAFLYLGEGTKNNVETAMGSSNPLILKFFLAAIKKIYNVDVKKIGCELGLRADQNPGAIKRFWAKQLKLPIGNFRQINIDWRTKGSKTYPTYKGVCQLRCANVAIQRKLMYLSNMFCQKIIEED